MNVQAERPQGVGVPSAGSAGESGSLALVIALTERVEAAMADGDWQGAADLEARRRAALVALLEAGGIASTAAVELREALAGIASRTHRLLGQAHHHRRALLRDAEMVRLGRHAASEYERNAT